MLKRLFCGRKMNDKYIRVTRESVCMGDDCTAPNVKLIPVEEKDMLSDMFQKIADCLPYIHDDVIWAVDSGKKVIGYIVMDIDHEAQYEFCLEDQVFCELDIEAFHCSYFYRRKFVYRNGENGEMVEEYPECRTLLDKVKCCMNDRFLL